MGKVEEVFEDSLMTADGELSATLDAALRAAFRRFAVDGKMHRKEANAFFNAVNGGTGGAPDEEWEQLVEAFAEEERDADGPFLALSGFHNLYHLQTSAHPEETVRSPARPVSCSCF